MLFSSEGFLSLVQKFFDEIGKNEAALLNVAVVVFHRLRCPFPWFRRKGVIDLGCQHEGVEAGGIDGHVGVVHAYKGEDVIHGFEYVMHCFLLHNGGFGLLHDEAVLPKGCIGAFVEISGEEAFSRSDGIRTVDDDTS